MTIKEIYAIEPDEDGWRTLPDGSHLWLGEDVKIGDGVTFGNWVVIDDGVNIGDNGELGDWVTLWQGVVLGECVVIGNNSRIAKGVMLGSYAKIGADTYIPSPRQKQKPTTFLNESDKTIQEVERLKKRIAITKAEYDNSVRLRWVNSLEAAKEIAALKKQLIEALKEKKDDK